MSRKKYYASDFVKKLSALKFDNAFNPYSQLCDEYDKKDAISIRKQNLELVLNAAIENGVESIWVARDLGYRGGRRTGLALTDEVHLSSHSSLYGTLPLKRATQGPEVAERTAAVVWQVLNHIKKPIFLWNVFPLHPHEPNDHLTNRCHNKLERNACLPLLYWLIEALQPKNIITIGRDAEHALIDTGIKTYSVRHPSYGGQTEFIQGLHSHYKINQKESYYKSHEDLLDHSF